ncbi:hypothetical protein Q9L58_000329 [Maublancomyces gigas]|uniref:Uncharacterized protein n=1 Tax=Discina gigas TaxID=1032678 RepID=A0ABR3GXS0_9PEZI
MKFFSFFQKLGHSHYQSKPRPNDSLDPVWDPDFDSDSGSLLGDTDELLKPHDSPKDPDPDFSADTDLDSDYDFILDALSINETRKSHYSNSDWAEEKVEAVKEEEEEEKEEKIIDSNTTGESLDDWYDCGYSLETAEPVSFGSKVYRAKNNCKSMCIPAHLDLMLYEYK